MSCQPGNPCYSSTTNCSGDPCNPNSNVSCETVVYNGPALPTIGVETCTNLCVALQHIDNTISTIIDNTTNLITASNGLSKIGDDIQLGGDLTKTTVINTGNYDLILSGIDTGSSSDYLLVITSGGTVKKVEQSALAPTISLTPNTGLDWTNSPTNTELRTLYNTLVDDDAQSIPVGGAVSHPASYWKTKTFVEIFDEILFPTQYPTYTVPILGLTGFSSGTFEVGSPFEFSLVATGNAWDGGAITTITYSKSINGGSATTTSYTSFTNGASVPFGTEFSFLDPNSPNVTKVAPSLNESFYMPAPSSGSSSTVVYNASMLYGNGFPKLTSINAADARSSVPPPYASSSISTGPIGGGTITTANITLTGIYPVFYGSIDSTNGHTAADVASYIQNPSTSGQTNTKSIVPGSAEFIAPFGTQDLKYFWIAIPAVYTAKTRFVQVWNGYDRPFGSSEAWNILSSSQNVTTSRWANIPYRIYMTNYVTGTQGEIKVY